MRVHAVELEDLDWYPAFLRDAITAHLHTLEEASGMERIFAPYVKKLLAKAGTSKIVDLCTGAGGPLPAILKSLQGDQIEASAILTDKFPNLDQLRRLAANNAQLTYSEESVDATDTNIPGVRTLFNAFHHFKPEQARSILQDSIEKRQAIGIFEFVERSPGALLSVAASAYSAYFTIPTIKPRRASWLAFTYLVPVIPMSILWDGTVSCWRVYSVSELDAMVKSIPGHEDFNWEISQQRMPYLIAHTTVLLGYPKSEAEV